MLILSRRVNEKIMIGHDISLSIIEIRGDQVKIGVEAPKTVKVFRQEVYNAIQSENRAAARIDRLPALPSLTKRASNNGMSVPHSDDSE